MLLEKIIRLGLNLIIGVWIARLLGPSDFGILNFGIALATIFLPIVNFGLQGILVKELFDQPLFKEKILGTAFTLKFLLGALSIIILLILVGLNLFRGDKENMVVSIISLSLIFQSILVIESWYESQANAKISSILKTLFFALSSTIKLYFLLNKAGLMTFAYLYSVEAMLISFALIIAYYYQEGWRKRWSFDLPTLKMLIKKSWLLVFSSISAVIYLKIDQIMIGSMVSDEELGHYSAAVKISEAWYFIPLVLANSLFPAILSSKNEGLKTYYKQLQQLSDMFFLMSFGLSLIMTFVSKTLIAMLYGLDYNRASFILQIHIWAAIFIFLRSILSKWLIAEEKYKFSFISQVSGAIVNVILNIFLIPKFGGIGAAVATVISYSVTSFFVLSFFTETRKIFFVFLKSFTSPLRIKSVYESIIKKI